MLSVARKPIDNVFVYRQAAKFGVCAGIARQYAMQTYHIIHCSAQLPILRTCIHHLCNYVGIGADANAFLIPSGTLKGS